jgi:hypothetical protein
MCTWKSIFAVFLALACGVAQGKDVIRAAGTSNPPPSEALVAFDRYELKPVVLASEYSSHNANKAALASFQRNLDERVGNWVEEQNARPTSHEPMRTLIIEPRIEKIRFIGKGARFWAGAFAGSSQVLVKVKMTDQATGVVIAEPEFYQHARGMAGAWTFGAADNSMLIRVASMTLQYLQDNQSTAMGGATGWASE